MPQDAFTLRVAATQLNDLLIGAKVNKINQPTADEITLQLYTGRTVTLCVSANAQSARVCPTVLERQNPTVAPNFCMLLRKHLSGAVITGVANLGYERITRIEFEVKNDFRESVKKTLVAEIMGKYSNIILLENEKILGAIRPFSGDITNARVLINGMQYTLPPAQDKVEITDKTRVLAAFSSMCGSADKFVASVIKGISQQTAREAVIRFFGKTEIDDLCGREETFYNFLHDFLQNPTLKPNVSLVGGGDFYPIEYTHISGEKKYFNTLLDAEQYYFDNLEKTRTIKQKSKALTDKIKTHEKKLNKKLQLLTEKQLSCKDAEINRIKGELLTAYQHTIRSGAEWCELVNYYSESGETIKITLDKDLSINRNAQNYFKKYNKQKKTLAAVGPQIEETVAELDYLADINSEIERCETASDFDDVREELTAAGLIKEQSKIKKKQSRPTYKTFEKGGFLIKVGKNNLQNDALTFGADRNDVWLHTKGFHSAHVIVETGGKPIPDDVLLVAAEICAYNSKARGGDKVPIDYCLKRYVKKPPKAKPGGVIYTDYKTVLVTPAEHPELKK